MLTARFDQAPKVLMQQFAEVSDHPDRVIIVFVVRHRGEKMRSGHGDFDWLSRERRRPLKFLHPTQDKGVLYWSSANRRRMNDVGIVLSDRFGTRLALK